MKEKELPKRIEYKYYVPRNHLPLLMNDLSLFTRYDTHCNGNADRAYQISSIYFENHTLKTYHEKLEGQPKRAKLRLRYYNMNKDEKRCCQIEIKYKIFDTVLKRKASIPREEIDRMCESGIDHYMHENGNSDPAIMGFFLLRKMHGFIPFIRIDYRRKALFSKNDKNVRITLDRDIRCCKFQKGGRDPLFISVLNSSLSILEIKSPSYFPFWLTQLIRKYGLQRMAISKYALSVQNLAVNRSLTVY